MKDILLSIFANDIGKFLAFKGGTLAYRKHNLDRFSTDIDLDIIDINQEILIIEKIKEILLRLGEIKNETLGKNLHRWIFRYDERSMNIKVELNKRAVKSNTYEIHTIENTDIRCMTKDAMFANKLVALSNRFYNRDLYDVHFLLTNNFPIKEEIITERTGLSLVQHIDHLIHETPKHFTPNTILHGLGEVLTDKQKTRVKKNLLQETIKLLKIFAIKYEVSQAEKSSPRFDNVDSLMDDLLT